MSIATSPVAFCAASSTASFSASYAFAMVPKHVLEYVASRETKQLNGQKHDSYRAIYVFCNRWRKNYQSARSSEKFPTQISWSFLKVFATVHSD